MRISLLHPDHPSFPPFERDYFGPNSYTIGLVTIGKVTSPVDIVEGKRERHLITWIDGAPVELDMEIAGHAFCDAIETECKEIFGSSWAATLRTIFGVNRRSLQRDRMSKNLLPGHIVSALAYILHDHSALPLSLVLSAISEWEVGNKLNEAQIRSEISRALDLYFDPNTFDTFRKKAG